MIPSLQEEKRCRSMRTPTSSRPTPLAAPAARPSTRRQAPEESPPPPGLLADADDAAVEHAAAPPQRGRPSPPPPLAQRYRHPLACTSTCGARGRALLCAPEQRQTKQNLKTHHNPSRPLEAIACRPVSTGHQSFAEFPRQPEEEWDIHLDTLTRIANNPRTKNKQDDATTTNASVDQT